MTEELGTVDVQLTVENYYELYPMVITRPAATLPAPQDWSAAGLDRWAETHLLDLTGSGHTDGDSGYAVTVEAASDPRLVGFTIEFM